MTATNDVQPSTVETAQTRAERIRDGLDSLANLQVDIVAAYTERDWHALGYESWASYVEAEFVGARLRLPRDERRELVSNLREAGMSTRAIAATTGVHKDTVRGDLSATGENSPVDRVQSLDGRMRPASQPRPEPAPDTDGAEPIEAELVDEPPKPEAPKPEPVKPRKPRTDVVNTINRALLQANNAADAADEITKKHLKSHADEAALWERSLARHMESLQRFRELLQEVQA